MIIGFTLTELEESQVAYIDYKGSEEVPYSVRIRIVDGNPIYQSRDCTCKSSVYNANKGIICKHIKESLEFLKFLKLIK